MVEYPIQLRWPYKPRLHRDMLERELMQHFWYVLLFGYGAGADEIITLVAFNRHTGKWLNCSTPQY